MIDPSTEMPDRASVADVPRRICELAATRAGVPPEQVSPDSRLIEDLAFDSLDVIELVMQVEDAFGVKLPDIETDGKDQPVPPTVKAIIDEVEKQRSRVGAE